MIFPLLSIVPLLVAPMVPRILDAEPTWVFESAVLVILALSLPRMWTHKALAHIFASVWMVLLVFEILMAGGRYATFEDMVLYDAFQLVWHLGVITLDLVGGWMWVGMGATLVALVVTYGLAVLCFRQLGAVESRRPLFGVAAWFMGVMLFRFAPFSSTALLMDRTAASVELYVRVQAFSSSDAHAPHMATKIQRKPDVRIYILESYGMTAYRSPYGKSWPKRVSQQGKRLSALGWDLAAIRAIAPTTGGRSWICDAAVLSGRQMRYQAEYQALTADAKKLDHLVDWFAQNDYLTILARPSDRARPGVKLQNKFDFESPVFFKDLEYRGKRIGWGLVPDQYTVGWLEENRFNSERPHFGFIHLATSHIPWRRPPVYQKDWHDYNTSDELLAPKAARPAQTELWWVARTFRRSNEMMSGPTEKQLSRRVFVRYLANVEHGLRAIVDEISKIPKDRPTLILILGDHQPAFISSRHRRDVPVHLAANDPALLEEFRSGGAVRGWHPRRRGMKHASIYSRLIRTLARYDGQEDLPPLLKNGISL